MGGLVCGGAGTTLPETVAELEEAVGKSNGLRSSLKSSRAGPTVDRTTHQASNKTKHKSVAEADQ
jgi:hypothetical protein